MKCHLLSTVLFFSTLSVANAQVDPNAKLGLDSEPIELVCLGAKKPGANVYRSNLNMQITPFEQFLLLVEGYQESDVIKMIQQNPQMPFEIIRDSWNNKWSKVYCPSDSYGSAGYVDYFLIQTSQFKTVHNLYDPNWKIKANVNRVVSFYGLKKASEDPHTLADLVEIMLEKKRVRLHTVQA